MNTEVTKQVVMILGMHRSGTSAAGRLLEALGFDFGSNLMEGMANVNEKGFWEDKEVVALDEHIFELLDSNWYDFERLPGKWWEEPRIKELVGIAETWLIESFSGDKPVAFKDPRLCRTLPFWKRVFLGRGIEPHILLILRHPAEVAASLRQRDSFSLQVGYLLWLTYVIDALYYSRNLPLTLVDYDALLEHPEPTIKQLLNTDFASFTLPRNLDIKTVIDNTLEKESRHQRVVDVISQGEVQGDVQGLAHELYKILCQAKPDEAKEVADKYRKRLYRLLDHHREVLLALKSSVQRQIEINHQLFEVGSGHSYALSVIHDKDRQLEENKQFIERCLAEIGSKESQLETTRQELERQRVRTQEQESLLQKNTALWEKFDELQQVVHGRELELSECLAYIDKCEAWISELNLISEDYQRLLAETRDYAARCELRIAEQERWLNENREYIAKCESRIQEQDLGLAENRLYIEKCEARVREQDNGLHIRDQMLGERLDRIARAEGTITELQQQLSELSKEYADVQALSSDYRCQLETRLLPMEQELQSLKAMHTEKLAYVSQCEQYMAEQDAALEDQAQQIRLLDAQVKNFKLSLQEMQVTQQQLSQQRETLEQLLSERDEALANKQHEVMECRGHISSLEQDRIQNRQELLRCQGQIEALTYQSSEQSRTLASRELELEHYVRELAEKQNHVVRQQQQFAEQKHALDTLQRAYQQLQFERQGLQQQHNDKHRLILEQEKQLAEFRLQLGDNQARITWQEGRINDLEAMLKARESSLVECDAIITQRDSSIRSLENTVTNLQQQIEQRNLAYTEQTAFLHVTEQSVARLEADVADLRVETQRRDDLITQLKQEIDRLQQLDGLSKQRMAMQKKQIDGMKTQIAALESEEVALKAQLATRVQELERYRSYRVVKLIDHFAEAE